MGFLLLNPEVQAMRASDKAKAFNSPNGISPFESDATGGTYGEKTTQLSIPLMGFLLLNRRGRLAG